MSKRVVNPKPPISSPPKKDLIVLAACKDIAETMTGLLNRFQSLQIRPVLFDVIRHPNRDPGCLGQSKDILSTYKGSHNHALVVFDREGCGKQQLSSQELAEEVEEQLNEAGWVNNNAAIVIDPELENWVWNKSSHLSTILGWRKTSPSMREWLLEKGYLENINQAKPIRPKEAMNDVLRHVSKARSSSIFRELAEKVSIRGCEDPSFQKLSIILSAWFSG